jgi:hypothetical protein
MEKEVWKDVIGYEGYYQASNLGRIKSTGKSRNIDKWKFLKTDSKSERYVKIALYKNGKRKDMLLHRIIAKLFVHEYSEELVVNHKDRNTYNNNSSNLEWVTQRDNVIYTRINQTNSSKHIGVSWSFKSKKWMSYITINKKRKHLGFFEKEEDANKARINANLENNIINKYNQ